MSEEKKKKELKEDDLKNAAGGGGISTFSAGQIIVVPYQSGGYGCYHIINPIDWNYYLTKYAEGGPGRGCTYFGSIGAEITYKNYEIVDSIPDWCKDIDKY